MNKKYALEILEHVEQGTLEGNSSLAKEAIRYLLNLKKIDNNLYTRIYHQKNKFNLYKF